MKFQSKCLILAAAAQSAMAATTTSIPSPPSSLSYQPKQSSRRSDHNNSNELIIVSSSSSSSTTIIDKLRGGAIDIDISIDDDEEETPKKKKSTKSSKRNKSTTKSTTTTQPTDTSSTNRVEDTEEEEEEAKLAINTAIKDSSSSTAHNTLGEAIRARAHILRQDKLQLLRYYHPEERTFDSALVSLGLSLGTAGLDEDDEEIISSSVDGVEEATTQKVQDKSSTRTTAYYQYGHRYNSNHHHHQQHQQQNQQFVSPSSSAVIANYFLKTHGGTHLIQCVLSLLASVLGMVCLVLPSFPSAAALLAAASSSTNNNNNNNNSNNNKLLTSSSVLLSRRILHSTTKYQLLQQTLLLAMAKHTSALVGAVILGAQRIPTLGIRNARRHLELVALDPVGQYLFYCSILVVWLGWFGGGGNGSSSGDFVSGLRRSVISIQNTATAAAAAAAASATENGNQEVEAMSQLLDVLSQSSPPWFLSQSHGGTILPIIMLTPILLREVISIIWVVSDVLSLAFTTSGGITGKFCQGVLSTMRSILDVCMSIVLSSDQWKEADSFKRQRTLARLVSQVSLVLEVIVGMVLFGDAIQAFWGFSFGGSGGGGATSGGAAIVFGTRLPLKIVVGKMACAHLYINFLLSRRRKIHALVESIRSRGN